jgi:RNA polymerase sigma-70 factor (ECF subfamily)
MPSEGEVEAAYLEGTKTWPGIHLAIQRFREAVTDAATVDEGLRNWGADVFLAAAAGDGDVCAVRAIEERFIGRLPGRIRRLGASAEMIPDILQAVRIRLFTGPAPRIRAYNGASPLEQWIKTVAIRTAIDLHRKEVSSPRGAAEWSKVTSGQEVSAETLLLRREHKREMEAALSKQLRALSLRDRTILRLHLIEKLSLEKIARAYGVHRVTVTRWVWNAGEIVLDGLRAHFLEHFGQSPPEFDSVARLARSQLSLDLPNLLRD